MVDLTQLHGLTKDQWIEELENIHEHLRNTVEGFVGYGPRPIIAQTGWSAWEGYFSDGYTPESALDEDRTYWED